MYYQTKNPHGGDIYGEPVELDYSANTNPLGVPPAVIAAAAEALGKADRYPDPYCRALVTALSEAEGVKPERILCGSGASGLIFSHNEKDNAWYSRRCFCSFGGCRHIRGRPHRRGRGSVRGADRRRACLSAQ